MQTEEREAMVAAMLRLKRVEEELAEAERNAQLVLRQVQAEIAQDLAPLRERKSEERARLENFIRLANGGEKFKAPGVGTAYITRRRNLKITDEDAFVADYRREYGSAEALYDQRLNLTRAKQAAEDILEGGGEIVPGVDVSHTEILTFRT